MLLELVNDLSVVLQELTTLGKVLGSLDHDAFEELIDGVELLGFLREVLLDILRCEDVFKITPLSLAFNPERNGLL